MTYDLTHEARRAANETTRRIRSAFLTPRPDGPPPPPPGFVTTSAQREVHHEEGAIPRPGHKMPWVYVVQDDLDRGGYAWGVYSQGAKGTSPRWSGWAPTRDEAIDQAKAAPKL